MVFMGIMVGTPAGKFPIGIHSNGHSGGLRANIITFGAAMNGCHKAGEWQQVLQLFEDLQMKALQVRCPCCVASPTFFSRCQWSPIEKITPTESNTEPC
jgi:hypothetical protein